MNHIFSISDNIDPIQNLPLRLLCYISYQFRIFISVFEINQTTNLKTKQTTKKYVKSVVFRQASFKATRPDAKGCSFLPEITKTKEHSPIIMTEIAITPKFLSYRNGYYQGESSSLRQGDGILLLDDLPLLVSHFKADLPHGKAFAFLNTEQHAFLDFNRGQLEGFSVFRTAHQILVMQFSKGRPVDRQLYVNYEDGTVRILAFKNGRYDNLQNFPIENGNESALAQKYFGFKVPPPTIAQFLQKQFCNNHQNFQLKTLSTGQLLFKYSQPSNLLSLGFTLGRNGQQLNSFGQYLNDKLNGMGCRFDRNVKYEGIFQEGVLHGLGMKLSNNRYSFGLFQKGSLAEAIHLQERFNDSLQKLRELKKKDHIKSFNFFNGYIPKRIIHFKGIVEITIGSSTAKQSALMQSGVMQTGLQLHSSSLKGSNVSLNQILSGSRLQTQLESSNKPLSQGLQSKGREDERQFQGARVSRNLFLSGRFGSD